MLKWEERFSSEREAEEEAERSAEGRSVSAMTRRIGAENRSREINMVIKKNTVFTPLSTFFDFSSFNIKPISDFRFQLLLGVERVEAFM